jgi:2-haloacid dehalogenase
MLAAVAGAVKNVVFDVGGVLLDWDPRLLYRRLIADPGELDWFLSDVCTPEWNSRLDAGCSFDEACDDLAARYPAHAELVHAWKRQDEMVAGEIPGTAELVERLRERGLGLYLLTNMPADVFAARRARFAVLRRFDGAIVSGEEGVLKPSREIFDRLAGRYGLDPAESVFIDDSEINVRGARAAGFRAHRFVSASSLVPALAKHGLALA